MAQALNEQLDQFISDMYSVELQALAQLEKAPDMAGDPGLAEDYHKHYSETKRQAQMVHDRLEARGGSPSGIKDAIMKLGGKGFLLFAKSLPQTPGRLLAHSYSYEAMEWAGYDMLVRLAELEGDEETAVVAREIREEELRMLERLGSKFDEGDRAVHGMDPPQNMHEHLLKHLTEAHALEAQSVQLLEKAIKIGGSKPLVDFYRDHLKETRAQQEVLEQRMDELGKSPSALKSGALKFGAMNWGLFFQAQSDTPIKLAAFAFAFEHLEIAGYELLLGTARRAEDEKTENLCREIATQERDAARRLGEHFQDAVEATVSGA